MSIMYPETCARPGILAGGSFLLEAASCQVGLYAGATLARDVPFSALYWSGLEPIRRAMLPSNARPSQAQIMTANFVAGTVGGGLAAAVTTPLDVVKTRLQVAHHSMAKPPRLACGACAASKRNTWGITNSAAAWSVMSTSR